MKNVLITLILLTGLATNAQRQQHRGDRMAFVKDLTVEQLATLETKKMTLALDLTERQQQQVMEINRANAEFRKAKIAEREARMEDGKRRKPTAQERFEFENDHLDRMIVQQSKMREILTKTQYQMWKKLNHQKHLHGKKKMKEAERRG
ncbi:MAG: hypothetical protein AAGB24_06440 [Bacteroidota bacterium]